MKLRLQLALVVAAAVVAIGAIAGSASTSSSPYALQLSTSPDRSNAAALAGATVSGSVYVFTHDTRSGVVRVRFWLDDPTMSGAPRRSESGWPHDFNGGTTSTATAFDTRALSNGAHEITAAVDRTDGTTVVVSSAFNVQNGTTSPPPPPPTTTHTLQASASSDRSGSFPLASATVSGNVHVFTHDTRSGVARVRFWLDDPTMSGTPRKTEGGWPHDFNGTANGGGAIPFDTSTLFDGTHEVTAAIDLTTGGTVVVRAPFVVRNGVTVPEPEEPRPPDQVHLSWTADPSTTLTVVWRTRWASATGLVEYRRAGDMFWDRMTAVRRPSGTAGTLQEATLTGLQPSTSYEYRVSGDDSSLWSDVFTTRTAPPPGPATFDAIYVADTGIDGRADGLTTGTRQVIEEIAKLRPLVVLPGGDYAYFDSETRFATLNTAIDAWFNQMQPISTISPLMPTYGNHEVKFLENYSDWAPRFATPHGFNDRRFYSFDIGDVHFVSIYMVDDDKGLADNALEWVRNDILAAKAAGKRWIVPYWHASPFADGQNHPSNLPLRRQLGPVLEELGVKLAISSHDQAYERTYPLTDIGGADRPTSTSLTCSGPDDGVVFAKVSPGGTLSNKNRNVSQFATEPAPHWTAVRSNTMHTFARIRVSDAGSVRFETYGVRGDGSPPIVLDAFELDPDGCPASLEFEPPSLSLEASPGGRATGSLTLRTSDATAVAASLADNAPWLHVTSSASTPGAVTLTADASGLAGGTYTATVTASAPGYEPADGRVTLTVIDNTYRVVVSRAADRSNPVPLDGASVGGSIYSFTSPDSSVVRARFWFDNPTMNGTPTRTESGAPFDFAGGSVSLAKPFDTRTKPNGEHTITAAVDLSTGEVVVTHARFVIAN